MPAALQASGCEVAALCPDNIHLARTRHLDHRYAYGATGSRSFLQRARRAAESLAPRATSRIRRALGPVVDMMVETERSGTRMLTFLADAIHDWRPSFVLCGDEPTRRLVCSAVRAANAGKLLLPGDLLGILRRSVGDPDFFEQTNRKSALTEFCASEEFPAPPTKVVTRPEQVDAFAALHGYPVVLKLDFQAGGWGVISCGLPDEVSAAMAKLAEVSPYGGGSKAGTDGIVSSGGAPRLSVQKHIQGKSAAVCLAAIDGNVLASFAYVRRSATRPFAPSTVVRIVEDPGLEGIARRLIERLGFSGICEAEFVIDDATCRPYLIELNPRPAPACHLGSHFGVDLVRALHAGFGGPAYQPSTQHDVDWTVALFPQEWLRDPNSQWLSSAYHDVPWDDPLLIESLCGGLEAARRFRLQFRASSSHQQSRARMNSLARRA
jgi:hypothetical protein